MKAGNKLSVGAIIVSAVSLILPRVLDSGQKILEAKLITVEKDTKDDSELKFEMMVDMLERVVKSEEKIKELESQIKK